MAVLIAHRPAVSAFRAPPEQGISGGITVETMRNEFSVTASFGVS
jgi:hypothetical protein